jgi:signal transduction histidine kinase
MSRLEDPDNLPERRHWEQLIEVYVPVHTVGSDEVKAVAEFYHATAPLIRDVRTAQLNSWLLIAATMTATFLLLWGMVRRASRTILDQQRDLRHQLQRLRTSLDENERMRRQLEEAGERTTALNEQFLHRVAADLHDGPAQDIALALLRIDALAEADSGCVLANDATRQDFHTIRDAMRSGLDELRAIARGLGNPGIAPLSLADTAHRAVRNFERRSGHHVKLDIEQELGEAPLAVKITLYRVLQESLVNASLHGEGRGLQVRMRAIEGSVRLEVIDSGPGFDLGASSNAGRLGLAFMQERVRLLGGHIEIDSAPGRGTRVSASIPLPSGAMTHD